MQWHESKIVFANGKLLFCLYVQIHTENIPIHNTYLILFPLFFGGYFYVIPRYHTLHIKGINLRKQLQLYTNEKSKISNLNYDPKNEAICIVFIPIFVL